MGWIIRIMISALAIFITSRILTGVRVDNFITALVVAIVLGVINTFIKPLILLLTLPLNIISLGLLTFIINGLLILLTASFVKGFSVDNIWWAILFSLVVSVVSSVLHGLTK
ncbi:MAG: phage holin family protein [Candidatus Roizmanbacteria bacterium]|nr:MAG: phage holin family protein [Candidatus Roizmanbacteria bacterium]